MPVPHISWAAGKAEILADGKLVTDARIQLKLRKTPNDGWELFREAQHDLGLDTETQQIGWTMRSRDMPSDVIASIDELITSQLAERGVYQLQVLVNVPGSTKTYTKTITITAKDSAEQPLTGTEVNQAIAQQAMQAWMGSIKNLEADRKYTLEREANVRKQEEVIRSQTDKLIKETTEMNAELRAENKALRKENDELSANDTNVAIAKVFVDGLNTPAALALIASLAKGVSGGTMVTATGASTKEAVGAGVIAAAEKIVELIDGMLTAPVEGGK